MAKNWVIKEAAREILAGNKDAISDIGKRFPLAAVAIAKAGEKALDILSAFDFVTVRKVESVLKDGVQAIEDEDEIEDPVAKAEEQTEEKLKRGRKPKTEVAEEPKKRGRKKKEESVMNEPEEDEEDDDTPDYESMSEVELFKLCKSKGIKAAPKQKKQYYLDLLNSSDSDDEDDWDEEEEDEKPAKTSKKGSTKKTSKKAAEDEDDDWDI